VSLSAVQFGRAARLGFSLGRGGAPSRVLMGTAAPLPELELGPAVVRAGRRMREQGVPQLEALVRDLPGWPALPDFAACARAGHAAICAQGTDGGFHRALFAQFLDEAQAAEPALALGRTAHDYRELAWQWRELGEAMQLASRDGAWDGMAAHAALLCERERALAARLAAL